MNVMTQKSRAKVLIFLRLGRDMSSRWRSVKCITACPYFSGLGLLSADSVSFMAPVSEIQPVTDCSDVDSVR